MQTVIYLLSNIVHTYAVYILFKSVLGKSRLSKSAELITYILYYIINSSVYLFADSSLLNLVSNIVPMFLIMFQYRKPILTYFFLTLGFCALGMFLDWIFTCISPDFILIKSSIPQHIACLGIVFLFRHYYNRQEKYAVNSVYIFFLVVIAVGTIVIGELLEPDFGVKGIVVSSILLMINFLNFFLYDKYIENVNMRIAFNNIQSSNKAYKNQLALMNESQKKIRLLKHDMKNHFLKLKYDIENGNYERAKEYIEEMSESIENENEFVKTGNIDFDCLLNYKLSVAKEMGVSSTCDVILPDDLCVDPFDLTVIFGNLLDNALNALKDVEKKILNINVNYSMGMIVIKIENTFSGNISPNSDVENHGYGLSSVRMSLEKYNGTLQNDIMNDKYRVKAILYNLKK